MLEWPARRVRFLCKNGVFLRANKHLERSDFIDEVNTHARRSLETATQVLSELYELKNDQIIDNATAVELEDAVETQVTVSFFAQKVNRDAANDQNTSTTTVSRLQPGTILRDRFIIDRLIGSGGMGSVYRGTDKLKLDAQDKNPHIAIKVLNEDVKSQLNSFLALQREAASQQRLAHIH